MKITKFLFILVGLITAILAVSFVLQNEKTLVTHPKGLIAHSELDLIVTNTLLMLIVVIPTLLLLFFIAWKYRAKSAVEKYEPNHTASLFDELILWAIPAVIIAVMTVVTWKATHELDPYLPLKSDVKPLRIQVIAMDWKWLFIYPEQGIATLNYVQFPANTPIQLELSADGSPMNSFWIPQLSGQIYSMTGMVTPLHIMADEPGEYSGKAAEINGKGYADMTFVAKSSTHSDFEDWIKQVKQSDLKLDDPTYKDLLKPSRKDPVILYSNVEKDLFNKIVMKYLPPHH